MFKICDTSLCCQIENYVPRLGYLALDKCRALNESVLGPKTLCASSIDSLYTLAPNTTWSAFHDVCCNIFDRGKNHLSIEKCFNNFKAFKNGNLTYEITTNLNDIRPTNGSLWYDEVCELIPRLPSATSTSTIPYIMTIATVVVGLFGIYKIYNYYASTRSQKTIKQENTQAIPSAVMANPKNSTVNPVKSISKNETPSIEKKDLLDAVSTFEQGGVVNYFKSQFGFAKAALYSAARTVANLFLATLSIFAVVTKNGRNYFKSCAHATVTNLGATLIGTLGVVSPHLGTRTYNAAYQSKVVLA